jgi:protein lin-28
MFSFPIVAKVFNLWNACSQSVIQMSGFRSLGDDEEVIFSCKASDKGLEATQVTGVDGGDCHGSHRRPLSKKRFRKIR